MTLPSDTVPGKDPIPPVPPIGQPIPPITEPEPERMPDEEPLPNPDESPEPPLQVGPFEAIGSLT